MANQHPIVPPLELMHQWWSSAPDNLPSSYEQHIAIQAAQWGADQELEACCAWIPEYFQWNRSIQDADQLRAARRPKPLSLKEQALATLDDCSDRLDGAHENIIRRALEGLPND